MTNQEEELRGVIGRMSEDGRPVIYRLVPKLPPESRRSELPHLVLVSWKYDGSSRNGMPDQTTNEGMLILEDRLSSAFEQKRQFAHAYNRTGNDLKVFAYYVADPSEFIEVLNSALKDLQRFPIDIDFYDDDTWSDFSELVEIFKNAPRRADA